MFIRPFWLKPMILMPIVLLGACNILSPSSSPTIMVTTPTLEPFPREATESASSAKCQTLSASGLPVGDSLKSSHILYQAGPNFDTHDQIWIFRVSDGSRNLVLDHPPYPYFWIGFLLDGFHFVLVDTGRFWLSDLIGSPPKLIDHTSPELSSFLESFPKYSEIWRIYNDIEASRSPDGNKSAIWEIGDPNLVIVNQKTGQKTNVIGYDNEGYIAGSWSPDGKMFAFTYSRFSGEPSKLFLVNADGSGLQAQAQFDHLNIGRPYWSPDGQKIVFVSKTYMGNRPITFQVFHISTKEVKTFTIDPDKEESMAWRSGNDIVWSPDSQWILFFTQRYENDHWKYDIETINIATGEYYCITNDNLVEIMVDWR